MIEKAKNLVFPFMCLWLFGLCLNSFMGYETPSVVYKITGVFIVISFLIYVFKMKLFNYVGQRIVESFITLFVISTSVFLLLRLLPGGPFDQDKMLPPEVMANIARKYNLDAPLYVQYVDYLKGLLTFDLGESYKYTGRPIMELLIEAMPASIELGIYSLILAFIIGIPAGVWAAANHNKLTDRLVMTAAISGVALPSYVVAPVLILIFAYKLNWLPAAMWTDTEYYIMPVLVLGVRPAATIARLTRASVLEVIGSDYIRTAKSKGLSESVVLFKHVLRNSLIPVLTYSGPLVAGLLSGSFIVEIIFAIPGMAKHFVQSVTNRDYPLILGVTLIYSVVLILANLVVDILYSYFDPRIKLS